MQNVKLREIFVIFFIIGIQLLGGGYVILPLLKQEFIEKRNWIEENELVDYYAISQCIPGLIAINISIFVGHKIRKKSGAMAALLGIVAPSFLAIIMLASILMYHINNKFLQNAFWGIRIGVLILIILTVQELWEKSIKSKFSFILFIIISVLMLLTNISPVLLIILAGITGVINNYINSRIKKENIE